MKRFILTIVALMATCGAFAQTKTAYIDLYLRGNGTKLRTTVLFDKKEVVEFGKTNLGNALNVLAEHGWTVDETFVTGGQILVFNRHKFHVILKKEYQAGENPFEGVSSRSFSKGAKVKSPDIYSSNTRAYKLQEKAYEFQKKADKAYAKLTKKANKAANKGASTTPKAEAQKTKKN